MQTRRNLQDIGLLILALAASHGPAAAQSEKQAPPSPRTTRPDAARPNANLPDCGKFQDWSYGQQCRRNDGKTCQVMGQRADPGELKFCK